MKTHSLLITVSMALTLSACGTAGQQWWHPDATFASVAQPDIKGVNDTQEDSAKEAVAAGDFARAAKFYEMLVSSGKGTKEQTLRYKLGLANTTRRMGDNERALAMFEQLMNENPNDLDAAEGRALTLMSVGKTVDASRAFSDIVEKDPKRWRTLNALGILFVTKNMVPEAMTYYSEALKFSPDNPAILNNMGLSFAIDKNHTRAIEVLDQANRLSKNAAQRKQIDLNEALVYAVSNDLDKAHDIAAKYYDGAALDNNMGLYAHLSKDDGLAKTYLNMALSQSPTYYERAWSNLDALSESDEDSKPKDVKKPEPSKLTNAKTLEETSAAKEPEKKPVSKSNKAPITKRAAPKHVDVKPVEATEAQPAETKAVDVKPEAKEADKKPVDAKEAEKKPVEAPVEAKPAEKSN